MPADGISLRDERKGQATTADDAMPTILSSLTPPHPGSCACKFIYIAITTGQHALLRESPVLQLPRQAVSRSTPPHKLDVSLPLPAHLLFRCPLSLPTSPPCRNAYPYEARCASC